MSDKKVETPELMKPSITDLIKVVGGKESRDGQSVVVGFGPAGYLRVIPTTVTMGDSVELPAARVEGRLNRRNGYQHSELRRKLSDAGIYAA